MIDKRYYAFISSTGVDSKSELLAVSQTLTTMGYFNWYLDTRTTQNSIFARRQIDDCDIYIMILGGCYGELSPSGVSHFHLEYIYAVTKNKPIVVVMHEAPELLEPEKTETDAISKAKFQELRKQLQRERNTIISYRDIRDIEGGLRYTLPQFTQKHASTGWIRPTQTIILQQENKRLKEELQQIRTPRRIGSATREQAQVDEHDVFEFQYRVHAYQDSNFSELYIRKTMHWKDLLCIMAPAFSQRAPEETFLKRINEYLNDHALLDVSKEMPRAHAAARSQIQIQALHQMKLQFKNNNWIVPVSRDERDRVLWELTPVGTSLLDQLKVQA